MEGVPFTEAIAAHAVINHLPILPLLLTREGVTNRIENSIGHPT